MRVAVLQAAEELGNPVSDLINREYPLLYSILLWRQVASDVPGQQGLHVHFHLGERGLECLRVHNFEHNLVN